MDRFEHLSFRSDYASRTTLRKRVRKLLDQAAAAAHPRLKGHLHRRAFELAQILALLEAGVRLPPEMRDAG
jgi:hypothetical protein